MSMIQKFLGDKPARFAELDGDFWVVAADIVEALGLENTTRALARVPDQQKRKATQAEIQNFTLTPGKGKTRSQAPSLVSEVGAYILIMKSRTPMADAMIEKAAEIFKELRDLLHVDVRRCELAQVAQRAEAHKA